MPLNPRRRPEEWAVLHIPTLLRCHALRASVGRSALGHGETDLGQYVAETSSGVCGFLVIIMAFQAGSPQIVLIRRVEEGSSKAGKCSRQNI